MNKTTITTITVNGWNITAEPYSDPCVLVDIESPCGNYGGSIALVEDTGAVEDYRTHSKRKAVPKSVIKAAQHLEDNFFNK